MSKVAVPVQLPLRPREEAPKSELKVGWHWYRLSPGADPFPVRVYLIGDIKFAWLCDPRYPLPENRRVENCTGEFLGFMSAPK